MKRTLMNYLGLLGIVSLLSYTAGIFKGSVEALASGHAWHYS